MVNNNTNAVTNGIEKNIEKISERLLKLKPSGKPEYRPFLKNDIFWHRDSKGPLCVDLKKLYPEAKKGDMAYVGIDLLCPTDYEITLYIKGNVKVEYNNEKVFDYEDIKDTATEMFNSVDINVKKGDNNILFMCRCDDDEFGMELICGAGGYRWWARDYIFQSRATIPMDCYKHETGAAISKLYTNEEEFDGKYVYPIPPTETGRVNFADIYEDCCGDIAYALTYALDDCVLEITPYSYMDIYINGNKTHLDKLELKKNDTVLIKALREKLWGFEFSKNSKIGIPFLKSGRNAGDKWLVAGAFGGDKKLNIKYAPERVLDFETPMIDENWNRIFWRFADKNTYLRIYMDTSFFAQWFYANMVAQFGILNIAKYFDDEEKYSYFYESMQTMAKYKDYAKFECDYYRETNFLSLAYNLDNLDVIGTIGANMVEAYRMCPTNDLTYCIELLAEAIKSNVPRFEDGTFRRPDTMWADDLYMSTPFLVRLGLMKNDRYYFEECVRQFKGFKKRLYMENEGIYSHIYFWKDGKANNIPWGRGNGWIINSLSDVCGLLPDDIEGKADLIEMFRDFAFALKKYQDKDGLWHQVLNREDSYAETSCTTMFLLGMCRGINNGWLKREDFEECIDRAYNGLFSKKVDHEGNIYDICKGSNCSYEVKYYMELKAINNDDHGTGLMLSALCEYLKFKKSID